MAEHREEHVQAPAPGRMARPDRSAEPSRSLGVTREQLLAGTGILDLQRTAGNAAVNEMLEEQSPVHGVVGSGGRPMEPTVRADMEARLGHDFGDVRIHDDGAAHQSATAVNAHAYTVGSDVVFQRDAYDPASDSGRVMLAHELTHVVQQRSGPVDGTPTAGGISVSDPSDRFEREAVANAERVAGPAAAAVQRMATEGEDLEAE